jgi:Lytic polysaccharide mono-oxygenase, cellulose-degrading
MTQQVNHSTSTRHRLVETPRDLAATASQRIDGEKPDQNPTTVLYGIQLSWTIGGNSGGDTTPPDWNDGNAPYPHHYEVWLDGGNIRQTVDLYWPGWWGGWELARTHWVCLGADPKSQHRVKIRAKNDDGSWGEFTNEVTCAIAKNATLKYANPYLDLLRTNPVVRAEANEDTPGTFHGSIGDPVSRALLVLGDSPSNEPICVEARKLCGSPGEGAIWQQVVPPKEALIKDPAFSERKGYLEYRKYFRTNSEELYLQGLPAAANPVFAGLNLVAAEANLPDWPAAELSTSAAEHTFSYNYTAHHVGHTWTHQWFVTKDGWDQNNPLSWDQMEPIPFMVEIYGQQHSQHTEYTTEALAQRKAGRHVIVNVWGGHGGPDLPDGGMAGEFFLSTSDVEFV